MDVWIFLGLLVLFLIGAIGAAARARRERDVLVNWAIRLKLNFEPNASPTLCDRFYGFEPFGHGHSESAENVIYGERSGIYWQIFQYRYKTGSGDDETTHSFQIIAATVPYLLTRMRIRPENLVDKLKSMAGFEDINFESEAFSRRYFVACSDRKFAYDLIHPQMIEYLMSLPNTDWQLAGNLILLYDSDVLQPIGLQRRMGMIEGLVDRIPDFLREDRALGVRS